MSFFMDSIPRSSFKLKYAGEIRFGPEYYELWIDNKPVKGRVFGQTTAQRGKYLACEEWLTTDQSKSPSTRVIIFDLETKKMAIISDGKPGFSEDMVFSRTHFSYKLHDLALKEFTEFRFSMDSFEFHPLE
eukprot:TRINITY_DN15260_c0_g2_i1.p1 TRINITY_DN15260_c0_g2~~TRINITY_DN15260_c0_g2_i1.p1  ORF type:complete len:131 (-),score=18.05 TRINITY_DN15260_c0_g2_i1:209-601(-)